MNDKIKELAEQAEINYVTGMGYSHDKVSDLQLKEFAELVVLECCKEIIQEPFNAGAASSWLKDYFEVEE